MSDKSVCKTFFSPTVQNFFMPKFFVFGCEIKISLFAVISALAIFAADFSVYTFFLFAAAALHEAAHLIAISFFGKKVTEISIYPFGAEIKFDNILRYRDDFIISAAGIAVNIILFVVSFAANLFIGDLRLNFFALCNIALAFINLLPAKGLDGSRIADCILFSFFDIEFAERASAIVGAFGLAGLSFFAVFVLIVSGGNFSAAFIVAYLLLSVYGKERFLFGENQ